MQKIKIDININISIISPTCCKKELDGIGSSLEIMVFHFDTQRKSLSPSDNQFINVWQIFVGVMRPLVFSLVELEFYDWKNNKKEDKSTYYIYMTQARIQKMLNRGTQTV